MMEMFLSTQVLQWLGCLFGLAGSLLLATKTKASGYGFALFLVSNGFWIAFGIVTQAPGLVVMQVGFMLTSSLGVWQWIVKPRLKTQHERTLPRGFYVVKGQPVMRSDSWRRA